MRDDTILCSHACAAATVLVWNETVWSGVPAEWLIVSWLKFRPALPCTALLMEPEVSLPYAPETNLEPTPSHLNLVHILASCFFKIHFNSVTSTTGSSIWFVPHPFISLS